MLMLTFSFWMYSFATSIMRVRTIILSREGDTDWVERQLKEEK
jgi:heme exporter protein C